MLEQFPEVVLVPRQAVTEALSRHCTGMVSVMVLASYNSTLSSLLDKHTPVITKLSDANLNLTHGLHLPSRFQVFCPSC